MGRRRDQFCWDNVDKLPNGKLRCKHCNKEFSGAASRIRNHLSGEGTDIASCEKAPTSIKEEASKRGSKKRGRVDSPASGEGSDGISSVTNIGDLSTSKGREQESTDFVVEFFVSRNIPLDAVKDPLFQTFLTRAVQHGFPSCLLPGDSVGIQRSLSNLEYEVNQYMFTVKESWKTTGCTLIRYNLDEWTGSPSNSETGSVVYGFYCPKGFIFVQGPLFKSFDHLAIAFENHVLNLPVYDVTHHIYHSGYQGCELALELDDQAFDGCDSRHCPRQQVQQLWKSTCTELGWVRNLIQTSEELYDFMLNSPSSYLCQGWREIVVQKDANATPWSAFTHLGSIMHLEDGIKAWVSDYSGNEDVLEIINNKEFWSDGKELLVVVTPLLQIIDLLDTLVPTVGYLQAALDKAKHNLKPYYQRDASKYQIIWDLLDSFTIKQEFATYLNPMYDWRSIQGGLDPEEMIENYLGFLADEEEYEKLDAELKVYRYKNPFANLSFNERVHYYHPVTFWKEYGHEFPVLQKCAIQVLSQPGSCMCNQVKKHILHCQGADNLILRLNYQMMQEFTKLGYKIYEPLRSQFFEDLNYTPPRYPVDPISPPTSAAYLGQIPAWMNEFILTSIDVVADGNFGYRAIAESVGLGQDKWREVRQQLYDELISQSQLYEPTFVYGDVKTISKALLYNRSKLAPPETCLEVTDMGLLVATTFRAKFVVMGSTICCTYLPLYLPEGWQFDNVPEIVVCLGYNLHFSSLTLVDNAPLPPVSNMWLSNRQPSTQGFDLFLSDRCASYNEAATQYSQRGKPSPTNMIYEPLKREFLAGSSLNVPKDEWKFDDFGFQNIKLECPSDFRNDDEPPNDSIMEEMKGKHDSIMDEMKGKHDSIMEEKYDSIMEEMKGKHDNIMDEMKDCFSIFFLIPTDYELEEDTLVQLWMAMECVEDESVGHHCFNFLLKGEYLLHSGTNFFTRKARYRINAPRIKDYLDLQRDIKGSFYLKWENESKTNIINSAEIEHVSLVCNDIDASTFQRLEQFSELQTLLFLRNYGQKVTHVPDHLFLSLQQLQALDLSGTHIKKLSSLVGNLIHLGYLDLSWTLIEWLPDTICSLDELQTLKLKGCSNLRGLPRQLKKLTKLRHLEVDILRQLATIPGGIGALVNLRTLSAFLVGTEDGCKIQELKELNSLTGDFCIAMLENVGNGDEAKEAALNNKQYLNKLELRWTASQLSRTNNNCYDVLKRLRPCSSLKELQIFCYQGSTFPGWISDPKFKQLVSITFLNCENVSELPFIDQLPFLKNLELVKMNGVKKIEHRGKSEQPAFFRLEKLEVDEMQSLRSWNWRTENEDDFNSLVELTIKDCPGLREFHVLSCLSSIKHLEVRGCPELGSLSDTKLPDCLEDLIVEDCPMIKRKCSGKGGEDWEKIQHVSNIRICEDDDEDDDE